MYTYKMQLEMPLTVNTINRYLGKSSIIRYRRYKQYKIVLKFDN